MTTLTLDDLAAAVAAALDTVGVPHHDGELRGYLESVWGRTRGAGKVNGR